MGYRTILAVVTEHTSSTVTARYAIAMATAAAADLVLYAAHPEGQGEAALLRCEHHLDHLFTVAFELDLAVRRITETGITSRLLPKRSRAEGADLVFYPLAPRERYDAPLQGDEVHRLLRSVDSDLAITRIVQMGRPHPRQILAPFGSTIGDREGRTRFLASLATSFQARITIFHRAAGGSTGVPRDVAALRDSLRFEHLPVQERSGSGQIARAIALEAIRHHSDLIVLGASERGALRRLFFGSPAGDVLRHPPCNAVLFRPGRPLP